MCIRDSCVCVCNEFYTRHCFDIQVLQNDLQHFMYIPIARFNNGPPLRFQPLGLIFLASFALILITQFVGMFSHRWGTMLHMVSITEIGIGLKNSEQRKVSQEQIVV